MAILRIVKDPDPILRKKSREITEMTPRIRRLIGDMKDTLHKAAGAGLAAVQVGVLRRVVIIETEPEKPLTMINPEIVSRSEETQTCVEGCLSIPDAWGETVRPMRVSVKYLDTDMKERTLEAEGFTAQAVCHELEHLDGILYTDKVTRMLDPEELANERN
ncbi:MAG: peptide deformylase [Clostridia bacterium]|nr:peptide deformylase [Clostridia bacterium]MBR5768361.1 peptide deformylase [Clostridia bacterium]